MTGLARPARDAVRERIVDAAAGIIAQQGLGALSFRDLAQAIGKSTTVIFNIFPTKAALLAAVGTAALEEDQTFHADFFQQVEGLALDRTRAAAITGRYILARAAPGLRCVRVLQEFLLDLEAAPTTRPQLVAWTAMRQAAWTRFLAQDARLATLAPVYLQYVLMEEFYAGALADRTDYDLLLRESLDGLLAMAFGENGTDETAPVAAWVVAGLPPPQPPTGRLEPGSLKLRLLDIAADQIMERGIGAVTIRSVTQPAATSTSMVLYHFGDMATFLVDAVWHSVFREIPDYLDVRRPLDKARPSDIAGWLALMAPTIGPGLPEDPAAAGFYVKYARLIAQICLLARRDPAFQNLALLLRGPEGGGTYGRREGVWPPLFDLTRLGATRFALWIKGYALLSAALSDDTPEQRNADLECAAFALVPRARP